MGNGFLYIESLFIHLLTLVATPAALRREKVSENVFWARTKVCTKWMPAAFPRETPEKSRILITIFVLYFPVF